VGLIAIDSCVFIYAIEQHPELGAPATALLRRLDDPSDDVHAVVSTLGLLEVLVHPLRLGRADLVDAYREILTAEGSAIALVPVTEEVAAQAAALRAAMPRLRTPDAIHAATALVMGAETLVTNDPALAGIPGLPLTMLHEMSGV